MKLIKIGHTKIRLESVDSTNNYTANLVSTTKVLEGTVIMASSQFAGKGQRGNNWISEPGKNLTFSVLLRPSFLPLNKAHLLTHLGGLAVLKTVASYCINTSIKWPNDIYVSNNKIAGVLVENVIGENKIKQCIMGIGLNVNQTDFPTVLDATSLKKQTQMEHNLENVLNSICENIEEYYYLLATSQL
jgi:BirA family biotin operon repressor/biotin-[acetyl-CoA-carboxylase] ligase